MHWRATQSAAAPFHSSSWAPTANLVLLGSHGRWFSTAGPDRDGQSKSKSKLALPSQLHAILPGILKSDEKATTGSTPPPPPLKDVNKVYFPGKTFHSASRDVVIRAMAGNLAITTLKTLAWLKTGSSAMMSEAIHSLVDTGNQAVLILGLRQAAGVPDKHHQYGYGRAAYFWSLISALGIFWLGAGVTITHGVQTILSPPTELSLSWELWTVLAGSFLIDGWVLRRAVKEVRLTKPPHMSLLNHVRRIKDPFMMAVLLEDMTACTGVVIAACGIGATHVTGNPLWDSLASVSIGVLLGGVAVTLIRLNQKYLLGQSVEPEIEQGIRELLLARPSIDAVYAVQSQWVGPSTFSYKVGDLLAMTFYDGDTDACLDRPKWISTARISRRGSCKCTGPCFSKPRTWKTTCRSFSRGTPRT
jgi:solute carrier family 30 (zinc transporter), member 9